MKFDAVVGNPPYQEMLRSDSAARQLFPDFIKMSIEIKPKYVSLITPSRWFTGNVKAFVDFRKWIKSHPGFMEIYDFTNEKDIFNNVSIMGGVNYFLYSFEYIGNVKFYNCCNSNKILQERKLFENDLEIIIRNGMYISILNKIRESDFVSFASITTGWDAFGISGNKAKLDAMLSDIYHEGYYTVLCSRNSIKYINPIKLNKNLDIANKWKVFSSRANGAAGLVNEDEPVMVTSVPLVFGPKSVCTETSLPFGSYDNKTEAENLRKYMVSKFFRSMVGCLKTSQDIYQFAYTFVPLQDFTANSDIDWSKSVAEIDQQLYKKYHLSNEEIAFIESMIKPME